MDYQGKIFTLKKKAHNASGPVFGFALALAEPDDSEQVECVGMRGNAPEGNQETMHLRPEDLRSGELPPVSVLEPGKNLFLHRGVFSREWGAVKNDFLENIFRRQTLNRAAKYYELKHRKDPGAFSQEERILYAGRNFDEREMKALVDSALDFWLTTGRYAAEFEKALAHYLGLAHCSLTNSGSSANLLAFMALTSPKLGDRRILPGDEVITVAAGFPTTVAPILQYGAVPVFVDISLPTYNIDCSQLEHAWSRRTKAVLLAHTLGNPFDLRQVKEFCDRHHLWLIEDNCDALGSKYLYGGEWKRTGTFGHLGTSSFYPPHHITTGEGGAVCTNDIQLKRLVESFRDWGRDCCCLSGHDNTCKNRFTQKFGELPFGYDHKYVYLHFGYNLKITEMQAAIGWAQMQKLDYFQEARRRNWQVLYDGLKSLEEHFIFPQPTAHSEPSWFGFMLTSRDSSGFTRDEIVRHLEEKNIQTRMLFAGNLIKQPCFDEIRSSPHLYRVVGDLKETDRVMKDTFWIGVHPGLNQRHLDYMISTICGLFVRTPGRRKNFP